MGRFDYNTVKDVTYRYIEKNSHDFLLRGKHTVNRFLHNSFFMHISTSQFLPAHYN
jgi:hypothetical protein